METDFFFLSFFRWSIGHHNAEVPLLIGPVFSVLKETVEQVSNWLPSLSPPLLAHRTQRESTYIQHS